MTAKITYTQQGDYLLPNLKLPEQPRVEYSLTDEGQALLPTLNELYKWGEAKMKKE